VGERPSRSPTLVLPHALSQAGSSSRLFHAGLPTLTVPRWLPRWFVRWIFDTSRLHGDGGSPRLAGRALGSVTAMPKPPIPSEFVEVLKRPNPAVMGTVRPDGTPVTVATWYLWDNSGRVLLNLDSSRKRLEYMRTNPRVSLTVLDGDNWYRHVSVVGSVTLVDDTDQHDVDRLTRHYTGQPWTGRDQHRVSAWLGVDFYHVWGF
jgi:PPOX class probable F420-dependent enzyme